MTDHPPSESEFSSTITRIAVAQICQSVGYTRAQTSALDTLTDIAGLYIGAIAHYAADSANSSGRTQSNIFDIIIALEDLGSVQGFIGAPNIGTSQPMVSSSILKEIMRFLFHSDEIPFAQPITKPRKVWVASRGNSGNGMNLKHVPRWLPDIPVMGIGMVIEGNGEENLGGGFVGEGSVESRVGKDGNGKGFDLPEKRGKVRFRMGLGMEGGGGFGMEMRNGVLCRGGIGKRILCHVWGDSDGGEDGNKKRVVKIPKC